MGDAGLLKRNEGDNHLVSLSSNDIKRQIHYIRTLNV